VLAGPVYWSSNRRRIEGYQRAMNEAGLPMPVIHADSTTIDSGQSAFQALIESKPQLTAICAVNDSMALGAIRAARALGKQVPRDLSVVGFDNIVWAQLNDPALTTLDIPKRQLGVEAARRLIALLDDPNLAPTQLMISVRLVERASTASPVSRH